MRSTATWIILFVMLLAVAGILVAMTRGEDTEDPNNSGSEDIGDNTDGDLETTMIMGEVTGVAMSAWALFVETEEGEVSLPFNTEKNENVPKPWPELPTTTIVDAEGNEIEEADLQMGDMVHIEAVPAPTEDAEATDVFVPVYIEVLEGEM